ncbi:peroxiredoxin-like 2C isoform X2 [Biomphalaria glabrata]|uniref:Peroxiredoxin-like 2C isoform X2 n=1 Tax=Biomphalaria glabrata TaxID=6526 RepID=A0A9W3AHC7_BIOGL|nr:peroxiredoxin-like 2C isoform X2 [Biomphalaria glabrata]KAI8750228.1 thioredoxin-like protein AAED1 isoform X2 [Biomphalaria glabrata]
MINNHYSYSPSDSQMIGDPFGDNSAMHKDVNHLSISRGERIDAEIDWTKLKTLHVYDEMENKIMFTDIFKHQKTIIIFTRHFLDFVSKEYVEDIAIIPLEYTQNAGVRLVVIGPAQPKHIKAFKKLTGLSYSLYVDPEREVYKALGCQDKIATAAVENSKHIKSGFVTGMLSSVWRAMTSGDKEFQGDIQQQGGAFIFGPGDVCHFSHIDQNAADHCPLNDILTRANVMNVSFPKDPRIEIV